MTTLGREVLCMEINEVENGDFFGTTHTLASEKKDPKIFVGAPFSSFYLAEGRMYRMRESSASLKSDLRLAKIKFKRADDGRGFRLPFRDLAFQEGQG